MIGETRVVALAPVWESYYTLNSTTHRMVLVGTFLYLLGYLVTEVVQVVGFPAGY